MKQQEQIISSSMTSNRKKRKAPAFRKSLLARFVPLSIFVLAFCGFILNVTSKKNPNISTVGTRSSVSPIENPAEVESDTDKDSLLKEADDDLTPEDEPNDESLVVTSKYGLIRIGLRPDLSPESVAYIREFVTANDCMKCQFYRSEKNLLVQGMMNNPNLPTTKVFGKCPDLQFKSECNDPSCSCHGPIMTKGMVAWAGGRSGGPDWFINVFEKPVTSWGKQHTVWGEIQDKESFFTIQTMQALPVTKAGVSGLYYLDEKIEFTLTLE